MKHPLSELVSFYNYSYRHAGTCNDPSTSTRTQHAHHGLFVQTTRCLDASSNPKHSSTVHQGTSTSTARQPSPWCTRHLPLSPASPVISPALATAPSHTCPVTARVKYPLSSRNMSTALSRAHHVAVFHFVSLHFPSLLKHPCWRAPTHAVITSLKPSC